MHLALCCLSEAMSMPGRQRISSLEKMSEKREALCESLLLKLERAFVLNTCLCAPIPACHLWSAKRINARVVEGESYSVGRIYLQRVGHFCIHIYLPREVSALSQVLF